MPLPTRPDVVFLDVGDTLMRANPSWPAVYLTALARHGITPSSDGLGVALKGAIQAVKWKPEERFETSAAASYARIVAIDRRVLAGLGHPEVPDEVFRSIHAAFRQRTAWHVYPDVEPSLFRLREEGVRLAVISNWLWEAPELFHEVGLAQHFEQLIVSARLGYDKPHPEIFRHALDLMQVSPERAVHVGDSYPADVLGARAAGIRPVLMSRKSSDFAPMVGVVPRGDDVAVVADLYDVLELLGIPSLAIADSDPDAVR
ncbi:MAG: HAD family hydrolase [Chloroflexota bacterium]|nr:HAD family hydrolase [Chloroflexota bacterium]